MSSLRRMLRRCFQADNLIMLALLVAAAGLVISSLGVLAGSPAKSARQDLQQRLALIAERARQEHCAYTVTCLPDTRRIRVLRWPNPRTGETARAVAIEPLSHDLPGDVAIETTTIPGHILTIRPDGTPAEAGRIMLRGHDGSYSVLVIAEDSRID